MTSEIQGETLQGGEAIEMKVVDHSPSPSPQVTQRSTKRVTIEGPNVQDAKPPPMASESGKSGSYKKKVAIRTCCGVVELTSMKLACLVGMVVTAIGLLTLAGIAIYSFTVSETKNVKILIYHGSAKASAEAAIAVIIKATYSKGNITAMSEQYHANWNEMSSSVNGIFEYLDDNTVKNLVNSTTTQAVNNLVFMNSLILFMLKNDQQAEAAAILESNNYATNKTEFINGLTSVLDYVKEDEISRDLRVIGSNTAQLVVICISLVTIIPILIFVTVFAINRDSLQLEKIRRANAIMIMDTMEDENLRALFRVQCEQEQSLENFLLLEKIQHYRSLCEKSLDLLGQMQGTEVSDTSSDVSGSSAKKKDAHVEKEYNETEAKKFEVAFEIFTDFMDENGDKAVNISSQFTENVKQTLDMFGNKSIETLPESMFNALEKETCVNMMDTHHRFKQSLAFQREMKIDKIKTEKLKRKRKVDF